MHVNNLFKVSFMWCLIMQCLHASPSQEDAKSLREYMEMKIKKSNPVKCFIAINKKKVGKTRMIGTRPAETEDQLNAKYIADQIKAIVRDSKNKHSLSQLKKHIFFNFIK